jgi:Rieske Fe-S protein
VYGTLAGMIIANHLCDITNTYAELYAPGRFTPVKSARRFLRENLNVAGQYLKDHVAQPNRRAEDLRRGEAAVIEQDGVRVAAFRDTADALHLLSAHCTHLNCIVHWNHSELSWDCPCHGSRFDIDGRVIEGPALMPLPLHVSASKSG